MPVVYVRTRPKVSRVYDTYWRFAFERQRVFFNKLRQVHPLTLDTIMQKYRFTNVYRASDRVSQFLIKDVVYSGDYSVKDVFFRIVLFKLFNRIETWKYLENCMGPVLWENYRYNSWCNQLDLLVRSKHCLYSGAYIMPSGKSTFGHQKKYQNHLKLLELMMKNNLPERISDAGSMGEVYRLLL